MGSRYLARKIVQALLTIAFIVLLNFVLFRMMPGSPDRVLARNLPESARAELRERWGLDKPLIPDQLVAFVGVDRSRATSAPRTSSTAGASST